jgi:hypothetical protein
MTLNGEGASRSWITSFQDALIGMVEYVFRFYFERRNETGQEKAK